MPTELEVVAYISNVVPL